MKSFLFSISFIFCFIFSHAQNGFEKKYTTSQGGCADEISLSRTPDGGYAFTGNTYINGSGFIVRTDSSGNVIWKKKYNNVIFRDIISTHDHGFAICGVCQQTMLRKILVIKTDSLGNILWSKFIGGVNDYVDGFSLKETANFHLIVYGLGNGISQFYFGMSFLICLDASGNQLWSHSYSNQRQGGIGEVISCKDNGFLFTEGIRIYNDTVNMGNDSFFYVVKTDSLGNIEWGGTMRDSLRQTGHGFAVRETFDNGFLIAAIGSDSAILLIRLDNVGHILWSKKHEAGFGTGINDISMDTTSNHGFVLSVNLNHWSGSFIVRVDSSGSVEWVKKYGTTNEQFKKIVCLPNNKGYSVCGIMDSTAGHSIYFVKTDTTGITGCDQIVSHSTTDIFLTMDTVKVTYPGLPDSLIVVQSYIITINPFNICGNAGLTTLDPENSLSVFPNPSSGIFTILGSTTISSVYLLDLLGNIVLKKTINSTETNLDLTTQSKGIYFIMILDANGNCSMKKIILQ